MTFGMILLSKTFAATVLAVLAEILRRRSSRPDLAYALWASVLAVLLVPSVVTVSVPHWISVTVEAETMRHPNLLGAWDVVSGSASPVAIAMIWMLCATVVVLYQTSGLRMLNRLVNFATPASAAVRRRCAGIAVELEIEPCPEVVTASGVYSPFLWHPVVGTPRIVIPDELLRRLTDDSLDAVLRHELMHLRRRDAWRRRLELAVLALWWWLPTAWVARRRLRELEEQCVDAAVLRARPGIAKSYALALVETEEFLSLSPIRHVAAVSAFTTGASLKARVTRIVTDDRLASRGPSRVLVRSTVAAALSLGLLAVGVSPSSLVVPDDMAGPSIAQRRPVNDTDDRRAQPVDEFPRGLPNVDSVTVTESEREIVLTWPRDHSTGNNSTTETIRLVRVSADGVEPRLWRIHRPDDPASSHQHINDTELQWIFGFLSVNNEIIDRHGIRHAHPGLIRLS